MHITNTTWVCARLCKLQKGALDVQPQVIKFTSCLPIVGGSFGYAGCSTTQTGRHNIAVILLKVALNTINQIKSNHTVPSTKPGTMEYNITIWKSKIKFCLQLSRFMRML
jgi:hypothetical protein